MKTKKARSDKKQIASNEDYLHLKFGTFKSARFANSPKAMAALDRYNDAANDEERKKLVYEMIDHVNGPITSWWTPGKELSKEEAKKYIRTY